MVREVREGALSPAASLGMLREVSAPLVFTGVTHHGKISIIDGLGSTFPIILDASMAHVFCRDWPGALRSRRPGGRVAGQGWHTGKIVF